VRRGALVRLVGMTALALIATSGAEAPKDIDPESGFRVPLLKRDQLDTQGKKLYDAISAQNGRNIAGLHGPYGIRLYSPKVGQLQYELNQYLRFEAGIPGPVRELAILVTARETNSQFEWVAHEPVALREGVSQRTIDVVKYRQSTSGLPEADTVVIQLGHQMFAERKVSSKTFARALKLWGERGLVNIVSLMGAYSGTAALLTAFDMQLPAGEKAPLPVP